MKILICYFSGTGNTKKVVNEYYNNFLSYGAEVTLHNIDDGALKVNTLDFDLVGLAYPIHAFNAPANVLQFAKELKKTLKGAKPAKKINFFIIKTSGEPLALNNISSLKVRGILKKYFVLTNEYHYCMPYNIIFRHSDSMAFKMWNSAQQVIPIDAKEILDGKKAKLKYIPFGHFLAWIFRIEHWGGRFNGKHYKVNENCVHCGLCAKRCPVGNITIENGEFHFGNKCIMCMRCSFFCPANAFKIGFFNKWKVNGAYSFQPATDEERHKRYCKKAYVKYFNRIEAKIAAQPSLDSAVEPEQPTAQEAN